MGASQKIFKQERKPGVVRPVGKASRTSAWKGAIHVVKKCVTLTNREGLHVRPAGLFSNEMQKFQAKVWVSSGHAVVSGKSIMNLIAAGIQCGDQVEISCTGPDEEEALRRAIELVESGLGEAGGGRK